MNLEHIKARQKSIEPMLRATHETAKAMHANVIINIQIEIKKKNYNMKIC